MEVASVPPSATRPVIAARAVAGQEDTMNGSVTMGRIVGVPLRIHWSAPLLVIILGGSLSSRTLPDWAPGYSGGAYTTVGLIGALLLTASLVLHEVAHAVTARRAGIEVKDVTVFGLGGVTRIGPTKTPRVEFTVSVIGPLASLVIAGLSCAAALVTHDALHWALVSAVLFWIAWLNLLLGAFNLLPAAPLDGGRILQAAVWRLRDDRQQAVRIAGRSGQVAGALMIAGGWIELTSGSSAGLWLMFIGFFVSVSALAEVRRSVLETALRGVPVAEAMSAPVVTGADWSTVDRFLDETGRDHHHSAIPLLDFDGRPSGIVEVRRLMAVPAAQRAQVRVRELAAPLSQCVLASPGDSLVDVLEQGGPTRPLRILVMDEGRLVGIVTGYDIARLAQRHLPARGTPRVGPVG